MFEKAKKTITDDAVTFILDWTKIHTFYTQSLCNHVFMKSGKKVGLEDVLLSASQILKENEQTYIQWRDLLTPNQWNYLKAVAKEKSVDKPFATKCKRLFSHGSFSQN